MTVFLRVPYFPVYFVSYSHHNPIHLNLNRHRVLEIYFHIQWKSIMYKQIDISTSIFHAKHQQQAVPLVVQLRNMAQEQRSRRMLTSSTSDAAQTLGVDK